eukprot:TRINITY_DN7351_c0_g1_i7.p1 TRINITY_DN7351_c0_g1~~TRINITY_DN7351_c0_g1_i7.p1  ORF type:complete len:418 (+),score=32.04 TRINITY_DN7351_c0_g1_i7:33-1286(+)
MHVTWDGSCLHLDGLDVLVIETGGARNYSEIQEKHVVGLLPTADSLLGLLGLNNIKGPLIATCASKDLGLKLLEKQSGNCVETFLLDQAVTELAYNQPFTIANCNITAVPSGISVGSCNWLISGPDWKIGIITSLTKSTRISKPLCMEPFENCDALFLASGATAAHQQLETGLQRFFNIACEAASTELVFVPFQNVGLFFEVIEYMFSRKSIYSSLIVLVSPIAKFILQWGNKMEWLAHDRLELGYTATEPLANNDRIALNALAVSTSLCDEHLREKLTGKGAVIFVHALPTLMEELQYLMASAAQNVICVDPLMAVLPDTLSILLDFRLNVEEACCQLDKLKPGVVISPSPLLLKARNLVPKPYEDTVLQLPSTCSGVCSGGLTPSCFRGITFSRRPKNKSNFTSVYLLANQVWRQ